MSPDNEATNPVEQNPTLAEDDKFRRTVEPSSGPNTSGYDDLVKASHTRPDTTDEGTEPSPAATPHAETIEPTAAETMAIEPPSAPKQEG
jgi:hypothetical protein